MHNSETGAPTSSTDTQNPSTWDEETRDEVQQYRSDACLLAEALIGDREMSLGIFRLHTTPFQTQYDAALHHRKPE